MLHPSVFEEHASVLRSLHSRATLVAAGRASGSKNRLCHFFLGFWRQQVKYE